MRVVRRTVSWRDDSGPHTSRSLSMTEAHALAGSLRINGATDVRVANPDAPKPPQGYDQDWRIVP
jgi:hypothetical protein